jgi:hypothetical protein
LKKIKNKNLPEGSLRSAKILNQILIIKLPKLKDLKIKILNKKNLNNFSISSSHFQII